MYRIIFKHLELWLSVIYSYIILATNESLLTEQQVYIKIAYI